MDGRAEERRGVLWMKAAAFTLAVPGIVAGVAPYLLDALFGVRGSVIGPLIVLESLTVLAYGILLWAGFHVFVRWYEEPRLTRRFGSRYERYRAAVPRWFGRPLDR